MPKKGSPQIARILFITILAIIVLASDVFFVAIAKIHFLSQTDLSVYADTANTVTKVLRSTRGTIYDRNGNVIAKDNHTYNIVCILDESRPSVEGHVAYVQDKAKTAKVLAEVLHGDEQTILDLLNQDVYQTELGLIGRNLSKDVKEQIESYQLPGIEFTDSIKRAYPNGEFASNLIGYASSDENGTISGKMGLELYLENYLKGTDGSKTYQADKQGIILPGMKEQIVDEVDGDHVFLTLDAGIQQSLEQALALITTKYGADVAWGSAMELDTGKVLAWGQSNGFDPNTLNITEFNNIGSQLPYEPGSTLKSFTYAAAINEGKYDGSVLADGNEYCYTSDENGNPVKTSQNNSYGCIYNSRQIKYGDIDFDHGLILSLNTVTAQVQNELITPQIHLDYLKKFGFFKNVDTDAIPEESGLLNFTYPADRLALSYGQGSTVTMLQLMQAYSAIFTDGTMKKPYFVSQIVDPKDPTKMIYQGKTNIVGQPITETTAKQLQDILYRTVNDDNGTARFYQIPECTLIGKTGTTEVAGNGGYNSGKTISSIMLALPAEKPRALVYFAFKGDYSRSAHVDTEAAQIFIRKVAMAYGSTQETTSQPSPQPTVSQINLATMPSVLNHTVDFARSMLESYGVHTYVFGDGSNVVKQYPSANQAIFTGQNVYLFTDLNRFVMPNMSGWTRSDVVGFWQASGFAIQIEGAGVVVEQNIPPDTAIEKGTEIVVKLQAP